MSNNNGNATLPRTILQLGREIRSEPDEMEPSRSYEDACYLSAVKEQDVEVEFLKKLPSSRRDSSGSFWRTPSNASAEPSFSSVSMKRNETLSDRRSHGGRLGAALQLHATEPAIEVSSISTSMLWLVKKFTVLGVLVIITSNECL